MVGIGELNGDGGRRLIEALKLFDPAESYHETPCAILVKEKKIRKKEKKIYICSVMTASNHFV